MHRIQKFHQFSNNEFYIPQWRVEYLFLGTFNPEGGEKVNYYYGRTKNQTWKLLSSIFNIEFNPQRFEDFVTKLKTNEIGCIDMIHSVEAPQEYMNEINGKGYKDYKIINSVVKRQYNTDKILKFLESNGDTKVFSTWGVGATLAEWKKEINKIEKIIPLVSPSLSARVPKGTNKYEYMLKDWTEKIK